MTTKHSKIVTQRDDLPPINSHNPLNMCSRETTPHIKNIIFPPSKCLWSQDLSTE